MANQQLVEFVNTALAQNQPLDQIKHNLAQSGWQESDIVEALNIAAPSAVAVPVAPVKYAGFWIRFVAVMIDGLIVGAISMIVGIFLGIASAIFKFNADLLSAGLGYLLGWGYFVFMTYKYEATIGKRLVGIKVLSDKAEKLTLGQVILREVLGKILSTITLTIGYIMAGFTERKQALHDKIADTVVVYKDPNKKVPVWVIIIASIIPAIVILGILSSIVLVSLNSARSKGRDASIRASLGSISIDAMIYFDDKGSFAGFQAVEKAPICNNAPMVNISPDGQEIAIFKKSCDDDKKYFCIDAKISGAGNVQEVDDQAVKSGQTRCAK